MYINRFKVYTSNLSHSPVSVPLACGIKNKEIHQDAFYHISPANKAHVANQTKLYFKGSLQPIDISHKALYPLGDKMDFTYTDETHDIEEESEQPFKNSKTAQYKARFLKLYDQCKATNPKVTYQSVVDQFKQLPGLQDLELEVSTVKDWVLEHKKASGQHVTQRNTVENTKLKAPFLRFYDECVASNPKIAVSAVIKQFNRTNNTNLIIGTVGRWVINHKKAKGKTIKKHNHLDSLLFKTTFLSFYDSCIAINPKLSVPTLVKQFNQQNAFLGANLRPGAVSKWVTEHKKATGQEVKSYNQFGEISLKNLFLAYYEECKTEDPDVTVSTVVKQLNERNALLLAQLDPIAAQSNSILGAEINPKTAQDWVTDHKKITGQTIQHHDHIGSALFKDAFLNFYDEHTTENPHAVIPEVVEQFNQKNARLGANINPGTAKWWLGLDNEETGPEVKHYDHIGSALFKAPFLAFYDESILLNPLVSVPTLVDQFNKENAFLGADLKHGVARNWVTDHKKMTGQTVRQVDYHSSAAFKDHFLNFYTSCAAINPYISVPKVVDEFNQRNVFLGANIDSTTATGWVTQHKKATGQEVQQRNFAATELFMDDFLSFYDQCVASDEKTSVPKVVEQFNRENEYRSANLKVDTASNWVTERKIASGQTMKQPNHLGNALMKQPFLAFYIQSVALNSKTSVETVVERFNNLEPSQRYRPESDDMDIDDLSLEDLKLTTARKWVTAYKKELKSNPVEIET